jgi:hypothetical protein
VREMTLPGVCHMPAAGELLVTPGEFRAVQSAEPTRNVPPGT